MTGGFQLPTAAPHKDGCSTAVQTGKVTTTEVCTAGTMSTVSVSKTVEHNRIHRIDYMTKYLKDIKHCRQLQLTWPHSSPLILIQSFTLVLYISQAQGSQDFVFNHHQSSKPYLWSLYRTHRNRSLFCRALVYSDLVGLRLMIPSQLFSLNNKIYI